MLAEDGDRPVQLVAAAERARIVEGGHEIPFGGGADAALDLGPGGHEIGQRYAAEIMTDQSAGCGRGGLESRDAGDDLELDAAPGGLDGDGRGRVEHLRCEARHPIYRGIAGAEKGDVAAFAREPDRIADAVRLGAERIAVLSLSGGEIGGEIEIKPIADPVGGLDERCDGGRAAPAGGTGAETDDREAATRPSRQRNQWF